MSKDSNIQMTTRRDSNDAGHESGDMERGRLSVAIDVLNSYVRQAHIERLTERIELFDQLKSKIGLTKDETETQLADFKELAKLKRIDRSERDTLYFMYEYFSDARNPDNEQNLIPAPVDLKDAPTFHADLCQILNVVSTKELNKRIAWAAPRGHAKSAYLSNAFPVHEIVFRKRFYILIVSETDTASKKFIEWISGQLKYNKKLRDDYGDLLNEQKRMNEKDNQEAFLTTSGILVEAASMGKQLRGKRNGSHRPDLVILDDLESQKNTNTPELRAKNLHWFNSVVMPIGDPDKTAFVYMGTIVHPKGLLTTVLERGDFDSRKFAAIIEPPTRTDLWDKFEEIYRDPDNDNRMDDAIRFYVENRYDMDDAVTLWTTRFPYYKLVMEKVNIGSRAFGSEYMNNPIDEESQIFKPSMLTFFDYPNIKDIERRFDYFGAWDIAFGKNRRSDYNAIVIIGRDRQTGILYVVDAWAAKCPAHIALDMVVEKLLKWRPKVFGIETVQAQHDFYRQLMEILPKKRIYTTKVKPLQPKGNKEARIETLEPLVEAGIIRFMRTQRLLLEQLEQFPTADHDDLPDALQMAVDLAGMGKRRTWHKKPTGL